MKKIICITLAVMMCFSFCACGNKEDSGESNKNEKEEIIAETEIKVETGVKEENHLDKWLNVDYTSFKKHYGTPVESMYWNGGTIYRFENGDSWFAFLSAIMDTEKGEVKEPIPTSVCTMIMTDVKTWLDLTEDDEIGSIEDIEKIKGIKLTEKYNVMEDMDYYGAEKDLYYVSLYPDNDGKITRDCYVELILIEKE